MHLVLFLTWDVSLKIWQDKGLLAREIKLYEALTQAGVRVTLLTWGGAEDQVIAQTLPMLRVIPIYTRIPRVRSKILRALASFAVPFVLRTELKSADIIKTNQMWGAWYAVLASWLVRKKLVVRTGFELYDFTVKAGHGCVRCALIRLGSLISYKAADLIFVASDSDRIFVQEQFQIPAQRIHLFPNWIDVDVFKPQNVPQHSGRILFVGRLEPQKNLSMLFDALAGTGLGIDLYGAGAEQEKLAAQAHDLGIEARFYPPVANSALPNIYNAYPVFVLPSLYEGNPKTLLEAMACARTIVATDVPGIRDVIQSEQTGLLCAVDVGALRATIQRSLGAELQTRNLGLAARRHIIAHNTLASHVVRELDLLRSCLKDGNRGEHA